MRLILFTFIISTNLFAMSPGDKLLNFSLVDQTGKSIELDKLQKPIVLEWYNEGCPFVRKHYDTSNMQNTQKFFKEQTGGTWVSIVSSREGKQGYIASSSNAKDKLNEESSKADHLLLDFKGEVGKLYGAKTTPQIVYIGKDNLIKYYGAIDSIPSASKDDIKVARNYVMEAVKSLKASEKIKVSKSRPYGCSVKY